MLCVNSSIRSPHFHVVVFLVDRHFSQFLHGQLKGQYFMTADHKQFLDSTQVHRHVCNSSRWQRSQPFSMKSQHWNRFLALNAIVFLSFHVALLTIVEIQQHKDTFLCRSCGQDITSAANLNNLGSKLAMGQRNDTILGEKQCLIQLFKNPHGQHFELITVTSANVKSLGEAFEEHSWFPGYAWRIAVCPQCGTHMGWLFEHHHFQDYMEKTSKFGNDPSSHKEKNKDNSKIVRSFVGLIYPNLIEEHHADSLIVTPKAYRS